MSNALFGYPIWSDEGTLTGGSWTLAPLASMQTGPLSDVARSTDANTTSTKFTCDLGKVRVARAVCLAAHNISAAGKVRVRASLLQDFGLLQPLFPDISKDPWTSGGSPTVTAVTGPDGGTTGWSILDDQAGSTEYRIVGLATSGVSGAAKKFGIWVKKGTATVSTITIRDTSAAADRLHAAITWVGTTPGTPAMTAGVYDSQIAADDGLWYYLSFTTTGITNTNTNELWLYGASDSAGTTGTTFYANPAYCVQNLVTSSDISGLDWTNLTTPTVSVTTGPYGEQDGYTIYKAPGARAGRYTLCTLGSLGQKGLAFWIKKGTSATSYFEYGGGTNCTGTITWVGTTPGTPTMTAGTYLSQTAGENGWYLLRFRTTSMAVDPANNLFLYNSATNDGGSTAYALPYTSNVDGFYEDNYSSGWQYAYPQIYDGPSNLLADSQDLAAWSAVGTPIVRFGYADPLGGNRAWHLEDDVDAGVEYVYTSVPFVTDGTKTIACYVHASTVSGTMVIYLLDTTENLPRHKVFITFSAIGVPSLTTISGGGTLNAVEDAGGGWYRISFTANGVISVNQNQIRLYLSDTAAVTGSVLLYQIWADEAATLATATLTAGEVGYEQNRLTQEDIDAGLGNPLVIVAPTDVRAQYWRVEIDDEDNPNNYVEIGRLMICQGHEAAINPATGMSWGWTTTTTITELDGGDDFVNERPRRRANQFTFDMLDKAEAMRHQDFVRRAGMHKQLLWVLDPDATTHMHREAYPARLAELPKMQTPYSLWHTIAYSVREVI